MFFQYYQKITHLVTKVYVLAALCGNDELSAWIALEEIKQLIESFFKKKPNKNKKEFGSVKEETHA